MVKDDQENVQTLPQPPRREIPRLPRGRAFLVAALTLAVVSCSAMGFFMLHLLRSPGEAAEGPDSGPVKPKATRLFQTWPHDRQPDLALVLSAQQHGFNQPCGCSDPQYGGLERRSNFLQELKSKRGWPVVALDLGDVPQARGPQVLLKYKTSMEALQAIGYSAVGIGQYEMELPLLDALAHFALEHPSPRMLAANLLNKNVNFPSANGGSMVGSWEIAGGQNGVPKVGVTCIVGPSVAMLVKDPAVQFEATERVLPEVLKGLQGQNPDVLVLLYQGSVKEAKACAERFPQFPIVLCLSPEPEPPEKPEVVNNTLVIRVGEKGRNVGVVGAFRTGRPAQPFEFHYQLCQLGPEYKTQAGKEDSNPVLALLEAYSKQVKDGNYLAQYPQVPHSIQLQYPDATYVGSEKCKNCHKEAYKIWKASPHAQGFETLVKATRPALRQFDGECITCHVTGFKHKTGYRNETQTPLLKNVGCENCHGPGSKHVEKNYDKKLHALMNPFKTQPNETPEAKTKRINRLDHDCQQCHDQENDVHWDIKKWEKIVHMETK